MQVEVEDLRRRFGKVVALDEVGFTLPPGRRVALVGPNGSGKSTLNRVLVGLLAHEGTVRLDGIAPRSRSPEIARRVAYLPQVAPQLGAPVRELVRALTRLREIEPGQVAERASALGLDLEAVAERPMRGLSGGMRQKLLLAFAMATPVSLLVLDEPTGSLDPTTRRRFFRSFEGWAGDATVILCSHRLEEVRSLVDHVLVLEDGRLSYDGEAADFLEACAGYVIDLRVEGDAATGWLTARGFRATPSGGWTREASPDAKRSLVRELAEQLGPALRDLEVRPLEELEITRSPGTATPAAELAERRARRA